LPLSSASSKESLATFSAFFSAFSSLFLLALEIASSFFQAVIYNLKALISSLSFFLSAAVFFCFTNCVLFVIFLSA